MRKLLDALRARRTLVENFGYLSAFQVVNMAFPLLTYPYLIRVLEPEAYGTVIFAQGIAAYYSIVINFGFQTSATRDVALHRDDPDKLSEIVSSILQAKLVIWILCLLSLIALVFAIPSFARDKLVYLFAFGTTANRLAFPQWYFQGIEKMKYITIISFWTRALSAVAFFTLIRSSDDYVMLAFINGLTSVVAASVAMTVVVRHGVRLRWQPWERVRDALRRSAPLFYSSGFAAISDQGGTLVVGAMLGKTELAYYNLGERLIVAASSIYYNMGRTLYPNLANSRDHAFSRRVTRLVLMAGLAGSLVMYFIAPVAVQLLGGDTMARSVGVLRILSPYIVFAAMGPLLLNVLMIENRQRSIYPNTALAGAFYVGLLVALTLMDMLTVETVALTFLLSTVVRFAHRCYLIRTHGLTGWFVAPLGNRG